MDYSYHSNSNTVVSCWCCTHDLKAPHNKKIMSCCFFFQAVKDSLFFAGVNVGVNVLVFLFLFVSMWPCNELVTHPAFVL